MCRPRKKDMITNKIARFKNIQEKILQKFYAMKKYIISKLSEVYKRLHLPFPSHDVVGHHLYIIFLNLKK